MGWLKEVEEGGGLPRQTGLSVWIDRQLGLSVVWGEERWGRAHSPNHYTCPSSIGTSQK